MELLSNNGKLLILNVYFPYECQNNYDDYMNYLGKVDSIIQSADTNYVLVIGDMNADTYSGSDSVRNSLFGRELVLFCRENNFILSDVEKLASNNDIFTHYSAAHHTVSWLDHCVSTTSAHNPITDIVTFDVYRFWRANIDGCSALGVVYEVSLEVVMTTRT